MKEVFFFGIIKNCRLFILNCKEYYFLYTKLRFPYNLKINLYNSEIFLTKYKRNETSKMILRALRRVRGWEIGGVWCRGLGLGDWN